MNNTMFRILKYYLNIKNLGRLIKNIIRSFKRFFKRTNKNKYYGIDLTVKGYKNCWVGYYDSNPFNRKSSNIILLNANNEKAYLPPTKSSNDIILYDWEKNCIIKKIGSSQAWNWQQGSRALWINDNELIYNVYNSNKNRYESVIYNVETNKKRNIIYPVQDINDNIMVTLDYKRLNKIRPDYGYRSHNNQNEFEEYLMLVYDYRNEKVL